MCQHLLFNFQASGRAGTGYLTFSICGYLSPDIRYQVICGLNTAGQGWTRHPSLFNIRYRIVYSVFGHVRYPVSGQKYLARYQESGRISNLNGYPAGRKKNSVSSRPNILYPTDIRYNTGYPANSRPGPSLAPRRPNFIIHRCSFSIFCSKQ